MKRLPSARAGVATLLVIAAGGCGDRNRLWDVPPTTSSPLGLADAVAVPDPGAERVLLLTTDASRSLTVTPVPIQRGARTFAVAADRSKLFVVSAGDDGPPPPWAKAPQEPALEIVTRDPAGRSRYPLDQPFGGLALDPLGQWAVLYADDTSSGLVQNPNELLLVDLTAPPSSGATSNPTPHTLRSFGGRPQRFTFTEVLQLPGGPRRLLIVETDQDVALVDLLHPSDPEITIQLSSGQDTRVIHPAGVAITDGDAATDDARIAIRVDDSSVVIATLVPATGRDFRPDLNLSDVGGVPSDVAWVRTDAGALALAALVPTASKAVIVDPATGVAEDVALPAAYQRLSMVTAEAGAAATGTASAAPVDVALLWGGANGGVAFWELGRVAGQPYRSVETVGVTSGVTSVVDVNGLHPELKILGTNAATLFLLDLAARTSAPFTTSAPGVRFLPATRGDRAWAFMPDRAQLASIDLATLHPQALPIERAVSSLFDIAAADGSPPAGARSLVAVHQVGTWGATVYDAAAVAAAEDHTNYAGLLTEGIDAP